MTYKLPEDIKRVINTMRDPYPYLRPNPKWKAYTKNRKKFRKHGFWSSVCWDLDWAVILYLTAAVSLDNPTATDADGDNVLATLKSIIARENAWFDFDNDISVETEKEVIIRQIPSFLPKERQDDLKRFLHLSLLWYKRYAPVDMTFHTYEGKTQAFWLERLLEMTQAQSDDIWNTWANVQHYFWW